MGSLAKYKFYWLSVVQKNALTIYHNESIVYVLNKNPTHWSLVKSFNLCNFNI